MLAVVAGCGDNGAARVPRCAELSRMNAMKHLLPLALVAVALVAAGCSSEDEGPVDNEWNGVVFDGSGSGTSLCSAIPAATNVGGACENASDCGDGGLCSVPAGAGVPECAQACFPSKCGETCPNGTTCTPLIDDDGNTVAHDVDDDGQPEEIGVCLAPRPGPVGAYGACGAVGACTTGLTCIGLEGREVGTCLPGCTDACDVYEGFMAECFPTSATAQVCAIACDPELGAGECPTGMQCVTLAQGSAVCTR